MVGRHDGHIVGAEAASHCTLTLPPIGSLFHGTYRIERCVATGGMGAVYEIVDEASGRRRALKVLLPAHVLDDELRARFEQESRITAGVRSEHLVDTLAVGIDDTTGFPYLVQELLCGENLAAVSRQRGPIALAEVRGLAMQVARGLDRLHAVGIVHRDVTPANIVVCERDDGSPLVKIVDFGTAKWIFDGDGAPKTTLAVGTPLYMAPEQIDGDGAVDGRADVYALAQVVYTLLVGEPYFEPRLTERSRAFSVVLAVARGTVEPASHRARRAGIELPPGFDAWFARATAKRPLERPRWATHAVKELDTLDASPAVLIDPTSSPGDEPPPSSAPGPAPRASSLSLRLAGGVALIGTIALVTLVGRAARGSGAVEAAAATPAPREAVAVAQPVVEPTVAAPPTQQTAQPAPDPPRAASPRSTTARVASAAPAGKKLAPARRAERAEPVGAALPARLEDPSNEW